MSQWKRWTFRLALALGMTRAELLTRISSAELSDWLTYYELEPWGEQQAEYRAGLIASAMANTTRSKRSDHLFKPAEFMRELYIEEAKQDLPESEKRLVEKVIGVFGPMGGTPDVHSSKFGG
jgi:hypothetical protein